jgi:hypothetical protein
MASTPEEGTKLRMAGDREPQFANASCRRGGGLIGLIEEPGDQTRIIIIC